VRILTEIRNTYKNILGEPEAKTHLGYKKYDTDTIENHASDNHFIVASVFVAAGKLLSSDNGDTHMHTHSKVIS
jgi:hypothetical protein